MIKIRHIKSLLLVLLLFVSARATAETVATDTLSFRVDFRVNRTKIDPSFSDNAATLDSLRSIISKMAQDSTRTIVNLHITGSASPEGPLANNNRLTRARAESLINVIREFIEMDFPNATTYQIPQNLSEVTKNLDDKGAVPRRMWSKLRFAQADFIVDSAVWSPEPVAEAVVEVEEWEPQPSEPENIFAGYPEPMPLGEPGSAAEVASEDEPYRRWFLKTNSIGWAMLAGNAAVEYQWNRRWSFSLPIYYSALNYFSRKVKFRTLTVQPEIRYWMMDENEEGFYVGLHAGLGWWNYALGGDYRYQDHKGRTPSIGGGLSAGYRMNLTADRRWRMEFTLGAGVYSANYDKYANGFNGPLLEESIKKTHFGIDNAAITFIYTFK